MADGMVYQFKASAHVPKGVTPEGVMAERDRIEHDYGEATIDNSVEAVMDHPEKFPNLRAFGPADEKEALRRAIAEGIRYAYRSVTVVRVGPEGEPVSRAIRVIHPIKNEDGVPVFRPLEVIRQSPGDVRQLIETLERDADAFASKLRDVLAEIAAAL